MQFLWRRNLLLLVILAMVIAQAGLASGPSQASARAKSSLVTSGLPTRWLSETTHNVYRVMVEGSTLHAEQVNIPKIAAQHGAYVRTECHRVGNKWIGTTSSFVELEAAKPRQPQQSNWCHLLTRTEILTLAPGRITGRAEVLKGVNISRCRILEKQWKNFVWVPQK